MRSLLFAGLLLLLVACQQSGGTISLDELIVGARTGDRAAIGKLVGLLGVEGELTNDRIYVLLVSLKSAAVVPELLDAVNSSYRVQREYVIAALGNHKAAVAVESIVAALADQRLQRRYVAAWALGEIAGEACVAPLLQALADPQLEVRKAATRSLIKLHRLAFPPLLEFLPGATPLAAAGAIRALGDIADPRAFAVLAAQASGGNRAEVILALGKLKVPEAEPLLLAALTDPQWRVRMHAAMALAGVGSAAAVPVLESALEDQVNVVREWAARSLETLTGERYRYRNEAGELVAPYNIYH